ncbi:MAG TPA: hypothetical protein VFV38_17070 [Ktedonobacteraceae bacterium]|nr:hypothetical protein [Ktedonobacteraceae bacterium]
MPMTIPQALQWWQQRLGRSVQFPAIPPTCQQILAQARAAGLRVGTLSLVSCPLAVGCPGTYDRETGDLCCHYDASLGEQGQREVLQSLLVLLASSRLEAPPPQTIAQEWEAVRQAIADGYALAHQWGYASVFPEADVTRLLTRCTEAAYGHHLAAELAGNRLPWVARTAYTALSAQRMQSPLLDTTERFLQALGGTSPDPQANDALLGFDRSLLRDRWIVTSSRPQGAPPSFGKLALPRSSHAARRLRAALSRAAGWPPDDALAKQVSPVWFQEILEEGDLALLVRVYNGWLIETHPQAAVRLRCWIYGDGYRPVLGTPRIYRLALSYEGTPLEGPSTRDLWILCAEHPTPEQHALEAAWQTFLASWLTWSEMQTDALAQGLRLLWLRQGEQG